MGWWRRGETEGRGGVTGEPSRGLPPGRQRRGPSGDRAQGWRPVAQAPPGAPRGARLRHLRSAPVDHGRPHRARGSRWCRAGPEQRQGRLCALQLRLRCTAGQPDPRRPQRGAEGAGTPASQQAQAVGHAHRAPSSAAGQSAALVSRHGRLSRRPARPCPPRCSWCGRVPWSGGPSSCTEAVTVRGLPRLAHAWPDDEDYADQPPCQCGTPVGGLHHDECDIELCPWADDHPDDGEQLLCCGCLEGTGGGHPQ